MVNQNSKDSVHLFENESGYVTGDGRLFQKDNAFFKGREIGIVNTSKLDESIEYFTKAFAQLEAYTEKVLTSVQASTDKQAQLAKLNELEEEISQSDAIGNYDSLLQKVESHKKTLSEEPAKEPEANLKATDPSTEGSDESTATRNYEAGTPLGEFEELVVKAENLGTESDWQYVVMELDNIKLKWEKVAVPEEKNEYNQLVARLKNVEQKFHERKAEHQKEQQQKRQLNLEKRQQLLDRLSKLVTEKKWQAIDEVKGIQRKWEVIKKLPADEAKKQDTEYESLLEVFEKNKVEYLVNTRQQEEDNQTGKLAILDKLNATIASLSDKTDNWEALDKRIDEYSKQWKKIGPVPKENANQLWNKFRTAKDTYFDKKYEYNSAYRKELERNHQILLSICEEAENLKDEKDLALAARKINTLHKRWKKTGPVPRKHNDSLWDRFKAASDEFNKRKDENIDVLREQEHSNYELKKKLCDQAEALAEADDFIKGARDMDVLMKEWKEVGPVPKNKSGKIWHRFKKAMDDFYKKRRNFFKEQREDQKKNLEEKKTIIEELQKLANHENPNEAVELTKKLQDKFNKIGFVPIKKKDIIYKEYKEACDHIYSRARADAKGVSASGTKQKESKFKSNSEAQKINGEIIKLQKECDKLNEEVLHFDDYITFVKPSKKGNQLRDQIQDKIDSAKEKMDEKLQRIEKLKSELAQVSEVTE